MSEAGVAAAGVAAAGVSEAGVAAAGVSEAAVAAAGVSEAAVAGVGAAGERPARSRGARRGLVAGVVLALIAGCVVQRLTGPRLTGTCEGACSHYVSCKRGAGPPERARCEAECPQVFGDRDSLMGYESLSCPDAVEYVDGSEQRIAKPR